VKILLADDHEIVRAAIRLLLQSQRDWMICGEADNGQVAIDKAKELRPDLVVLDIVMPVLNGFDAAMLIKALLPGTAVLAYTILESEGLLHESQRIGLDGYVSKFDGGRALLQAIDEVQRRRSQAAADRPRSASIEC
jgi:DNA-binding NarL/FixJ family response regulator